MAEIARATLARTWASSSFTFAAAARAIEPLLVEVDAEHERFGIEGGEKVADRDLLIVGDVDVVDDAGYLGRDLHEVGADIGVRRIGDERDRYEIQEGDNPRRAEDDPAQAAGLGPRRRRIVLGRS
jgi:hypothetical protein